MGTTYEALLANRRTSAVVVGASAGAIEALSVLLPALPAETPFPVIVVVHLPENQQSLLAAIFAAKCAMRVAEPYDKLPVMGGIIWFAPPGYHLLVETDRTFSFSIGEPVNYSRPAIDVLFDSAADAYGSGLVAVVLTGASRDGSAGARNVQLAGGLVAVQDPGTAESPVMPTHAIQRASPHVVGSLQELAAFLRELAMASLP